MQVPDAVKLRTPGLPRGPLIAALACWATLALVFSLAPQDTQMRAFAAIGLYATAAVFAGPALAAVSRTGGRAERIFWGFLGGGMALRFAGDVVWMVREIFGLKVVFPTVALQLQDVAYLLAYPLLFAALVQLVRTTTHGIALVTALDAASIMLSVGVLVWYLVLGPSAPVAGLTGPREAAVALFQPVCNTALMYLCLVTLSTDGKPRFASPLAAALLSFLVADALYLSLRSQGPYGLGDWPELFWSLGLLLVGAAALRPAKLRPSPERRIAPWRVFVFWFGPLSPSVHFFIVVVWAAANPPLPSYALAGLAVFLAYLTLRISLVSVVSRRLAREQEDAARKLEKSRLLYELHDSAKQSVHGLSLMLKDALEAHRRGDQETGKLLENALEAAREAEFRISRPYDELQGEHGQTPESPDAFLRRRLGKFEEYFGIKAHEDLRASLASLKPAEIAAINRVTIEALWNVAKHSGAGNVWLESRRVGSVFIVRLRDDGRGFDTAAPPPGMGLQYMRRRAAEAQGRLDVISGPGRGTTVQIRFTTR